MASSPSSPVLNYRADIDGLRAVAILLVCIFHFQLLPIGEAGFIGVDVFFVISGFLITRILLRDLNTDRFSLSRFYVARLRRLMPALLATLVLYLIAAAFVFLPDKFEELARETLLTQFYVVNIYFWRTINYFGLQAYNVPLLHMWSLAIEEQFYLVFPIFLLAVHHWARHLMVPALGLMVLGSFLLGWWATGWKPVASFYLLPTRLWELGAGAVLAAVLGRYGPLPRGQTLAGFCGVALIVLALVIHTKATPFPGWFAALPVLGSVLLIIAGPATPTGMVLAMKPMVWVGWISYPLYLVHWPVLHILREGMPELTITHRWLGLAISMALAWMIWRFVEQPVRHGRSLASTRGLLTGFGTVTALITASAIIGLMTHGFPNRLPADARVALAYADDVPPAASFECEFSLRNVNAAPCLLGQTAPAASAPKIAIIGDSHAHMLVGAFETWLNQQNASGALWFHAGCQPILGAGDRDCTGLMRKALSDIKADSAITHVFLVSAWRHDPALYGRAYLSGDAADRAFQAGFEAVLNELAAPQRKIILFEPMYAAAARVPHRMARNIYFGRDLPLDSTLEDHQAAFAAFNDITFAVTQANPTVTRVSLISDLCVGGICPALLDGTPLFVDGTHIRFGQSNYFADQLAKRISLN